ncbi:MAG: flagellar biosynthesis regulator FlaF [Alphaproteobacteria bacterium]|nr:flagellar biosynthesis regulator FlaF [Alphaproteobacteria bacterium]
MQPSNSSQAYQSSQKLGSAPRQTEARALLEAARMMDAAVESDDMDAYRAALRLNWRLWTIIQADVTAPECELPTEIRENIVSLSVFIDKHTVGALADRASEKLRVLIDINRNIASGLMGLGIEEAGADPNQDDASDDPQKESADSGNFLA